MGFRPKKLAEKYKLSANTLRNYETKGLIPPADRSSNGYRMYTDLHEHYLACIQAMAPAFGMEVTAKVMHCLQCNKIDDALWIAREREVMLFREKESLDQLASELISYAEGHAVYDANQRFSIHEASRRTGAPKSAIRYWEKSSQFSAERDPDNGYRLYNEGELIKIRMFQLMQSSVYSEETVNLKRSIALLELHNFDHAMQLSESIRDYLNHTIKLQARGVYFLYRLIQSLSLSETPESP